MAPTTPIGQIAGSSTASQTYYAVGLDAKTRPALDGDRSVDAVVIGGGYAGVGAVRAFAAEGMQAVLLERDTVGAAASGTNGGILLLSEGAHLADNDASSLADDALGGAAREFVDLIERHGIDADLHRGTIALALTGRQARNLADMAKTANAMGREGVRFLDRNALEEHVKSKRYAGGYLEPDNMALNPLKLLEGLAQVAESEGAEILEHTRAAEIRKAPGGKVIVRTDRGNVTAKRLVVATGADLGELVPRARRKVMRVYTHVAVTEPIDAELLDRAVGSDLAFSEVIFYSRYFRKIGDGRLLFGISTVFDPVGRDNLDRVIRTQLRGTFPELGGVKLDYAWLGVFATTGETTPWMERIGPSSVLVMSNGVLASWHAGQLAARATSVDFAQYGRLTGYKHGNWPPLRIPNWAVRLGGTVYLTAHDRL